MIRTLTTAAALLACATTAAAQDAPPEAPSETPSGSWSFAVGAATDNRSRDVSNSGGDPFVWGEAQWESASGLFYAGAGAETIKSSGADLEVQLNAGFRPQVAGFDVTLAATHKWQIDADPGADAEAWEFTADVARSIGPASGRLRLQYSPDGTGATEAWTWAEARVGWAFTDKLEASAAIGRREQDNSVDYTGWNVGFSYALTRSLEADLRYHANDADLPDERYDDALVAGLSFAF